MTPREEYLLTSLLSLHADFLLKDETTWPQRPSAMLSDQEEDAD